MPRPSAEQRALGGGLSHWGWTGDSAPPKALCRVAMRRGVPGPSRFTSDARCPSSLMFAPDKAPQSGRPVVGEFEHKFQDASSLSPAGKVIQKASLGPWGFCYVAAVPLGSGEAEKTRRTVVPGTGAVHTEPRWTSQGSRCLHSHWPALNAPTPPAVPVGPTPSPRRGAGSPSWGPRLPGCRPPLEQGSCVPSQRLTAAVWAASREA